MLRKAKTYQFTIERNLVAKHDYSTVKDALQLLQCDYSFEIFWYTEI